MDDEAVWVERWSHLCTVFAVVVTMSNAYVDQDRGIHFLWAGRDERQVTPWSSSVVGRFGNPKRRS
jgi:hypothetical protein